MDPRPARSNGGPPSWLVGVVAVAAGSLLLAGCGGGGGGEGAGGSGAEGYPDREIAFIVPFAAGGPTDTVTRLVAEPMSAKLGQQIVVRNVEGAGGTVAAGEVANADGDGYTVLMHHIGMSTAPALYPNLAYKPLEDFKTVGLVTTVPMTIASVFSRTIRRRRLRCWPMTPTLKVIRSRSTR